MKHRFDVPLSDGSTIFGQCEITERGDEVKIEIVEFYHELPMIPVGNGVPVASTLTCLNALIPAIHGFMWPVQELSAAILFTVATIHGFNTDPSHVTKYN